MIPPDRKKDQLIIFPLHASLNFSAIGDGCSSTFSSLFPPLEVYLTSGGGALLLFIGIDCESPMRSISSCAVLRCLSDSVFLQDLHILTPDLATQALVLYCSSYSSADPYQRYSSPYRSQDFYQEIFPWSQFYKINSFFLQLAQ